MLLMLSLLFGKERAKNVSCSTNILVSKKNWKEEKRLSVESKLVVDGGRKSRVSWGGKGLLNRQLCLWFVIFTFFY